MTLLEIQLTIQQIFQLLGKPLEMSLEQYNNYLRMAQDELFKEFAHGYMSGNGAEVDMRVRSAINPFVHEDNIAGTPGTLYGITASQFQHSASVFEILDMYFVNGTLGFPNATTKVDLLSNNEVGDRLQNAITYPSTQYPIAVWDQVTLRILVLPYIHNAGGIRLKCLYRPTTPVLVETITNSVRTQDASSVALQLDAMFHTDVIRKILQYLGVSIGNEFIATVAQQQQNLEK